MKLIVNQNAKEFNDSDTLEQVIQQLNLPSQKGIAVALNNQVIYRAQWSSTQLNKGDSITLMQAVQGG